MKKLLLVMVFLCTTGTMMNANSSSEKLLNNLEIIEIQSCAQYARDIILQAAADYNLDISRGGSHFEVMMEAYHAIYADCYNN
jgi:hypothetical protein